MSDMNKYLDLGSEEIERRLLAQKEKLSEASDIVAEKRRALHTAESVHLAARRIQTELEKDIAQLQGALHILWGRQERQRLHALALAQLKEDVAALSQSEDPIMRGLVSVLQTVLNTPDALVLLVDLLEEQVTSRRENRLRISIREKGVFSLQVVLTRKRQYFILYRGSGSILTRIRALYIKFRPSSTSISLDDHVVVLQVVATEEQPQGKPMALLSGPNSLEVLPVRLGELGDEIAHHLLNGGITIGKLEIKR